jgi:hypothetical protein
MNIPSYLFQSPSPQQVQIGKLDPSSVQQEEVDTQSQTQESTQQVQEVEDFNPQASEKTNPLSSDHILDLYA